MSSFSFDAALGESLYSIAPTKGVEVGTVVEFTPAKKTKPPEKPVLASIVFRSKDFSKIPVQPYQIFLVVNPAMTEVLAEVVVTVVDPKTKKVRARIVRAVKDKIKFLKKKIIRLGDLQKSVDSGLIYRQNPIFKVHYQRKTLLLPSLNVMTGLALDQEAKAAGVVVEVFAPTSSLLTWMNAFGFRLGLTQVEDFTLNIARTGSKDVREADVSGDRTSVELLIRPWFKTSFIAEVGLSVGVVNQVNDKIVLQKSDKSGEEELSMTSSYLSVGAELGFNPVTNVYYGIDFKMEMDHEFRVKDPAVTEEIKGNWQTTETSLWCSMLIPIGRGFGMSLKFASTLFQHDLTKTPVSATEVEEAYTMQGFGTQVELGLNYSL